MKTEESKGKMQESASPVTKVKKTAGPLTVDPFVVPCKFFVSKETSLVDIIDLMETNIIRHLPVVENDRPIGIISERDVNLIRHLRGNARLTADDFMVEAPYTVTLGTSLAKVVEEMQNNKYGSVLVTNHEGHLWGILTTIDLLQIFSHLLQDQEITTSV